MVKTLRICIVDPDPTKTQAFLSAHLSGGLWSLLARKCYPIGFLGVRTFRSRKTPSIFCAHWILDFGGMPGGREANACLPRA